MTAFRLFTRPGRRHHFPKVCNLLERLLTDPEPHQANRENRAAWSQAERGGVLLQIPGRDST